MSISINLDKLKAEKQYSIPAKRLKEHLQPILSKSEELKKRWMWELLQNASDLGDDISVEFELNQDTLIFRHNGPPFSLEEAYNLIVPDSGKDDDEIKQAEKSVIGQFGTGFISTHILSSTIAVQGIVKDEGYHNFFFELDRGERTDREYLMQSIIESEKQYAQSLSSSSSYEVSKDMDTAFSYDLHQSYEGIDGQEVVALGMEFFEEIIPFVMAFRSELSQVTTIDNRQSSSFPVIKTYVTNWLDTSIEGLYLIEIVCTENAQIIWKRIVGSVVQDETTIAFLVEHVSEEQYRFMPYPQICPSLFCAFPMIGSEFFTFPVVINSPSFSPNRERDGIELSVHDQGNRKRLEEAVSGFERLMKIAEEHEWLDVFHVCALDIPKLKDATTQDWLKQNIFNNLAKVIREAKIVELSEHSDTRRKALSETGIPYADRRLANCHEIVLQLYQLYSGISPKQVLKSEHVIFWFECINFDIFEDLKWDLKTLLDAIKEIQTLETFCQETELQEAEATEWLKDLCRYCIERDEMSLFSKYAIVPNQNNELKALPKLYYDAVHHDHLNPTFDEKLKDILALAAPQNDYRDSLLHSDFHDIKELLGEEQVLTIKDLATVLEEALQSLDIGNHNPSAMDILQQLFFWFSHSGLAEETLRGLFPWFSDKRSQLYMETQTPDQRDLFFNIVRSGKEEGLAALANSSLSDQDLIAIAQNQDLVGDFFKWINQSVADNPDKELGDIGEAYVYRLLCDLFGKDLVRWEDVSAYDFLILNPDQSPRYYIDAKTTGRGIANSDNVPFFMRYAQWQFLEKKPANDKYLLARVFKQGDQFEVKFLNILMEEVIS